MVWGLLTIYWKQLGDFDAFELIGWRITAAAVIMAVVLTVTRRWGISVCCATTAHCSLECAARPCCSRVNWTAYVWAVVHDQVLETALGYFIAPLGTVTVGVLVLHEPLRRSQRVALGLRRGGGGRAHLSYGRVPCLAIVIAISWTATAT